MRRRGIGAPENLELMNSGTERFSVAGRRSRSADREWGKRGNWNGTAGSGIGDPGCPRIRHLRADNALACIGSAATLPGREPHSSGFCGTDQSSTRLRFVSEIHPATLNSVELLQQFSPPQNLSSVEVNNTVRQKMKPVPPEFVELRRRFPLAAVRIGYSGVELDSIAGIPDAQKGYSIIPEGSETDWKASWLVIGHETSMGDPIFIDIEEEEFPVYIAPHGEGSWSPTQIAPSAGAFFAILSRLAAVVKGRENPVAMERNPISEIEKERFLGFLGEFFTDEIPLFWTLLFETFKE